jgi:hypothetical protein
MFGVRPLFGLTPFSATNRVQFPFPAVPAKLKMECHWVCCSAPGVWRCTHSGTTRGQCPGIKFPSNEHGQCRGREDLRGSLGVTGTAQSNGGGGGGGLGGGEGGGGGGLLGGGGGLCNA